jgi:hypothetical protein
MALSLWSTAADPRRFYLLPDEEKLFAGPLGISDLYGRSDSVDPASVTAFEITEDEARRWAKDQLGQALGEIRGAIDEKLGDWRRQFDEFARTPVAEHTTVTPNAPSVLLDLINQFPGVLSKSLSGDEARVGEAKNKMADLQRRLKSAGIDLDDRFANFPDRLASLRRDAEQELAAKKPTKNESPPG